MKTCCETCGKPLTKKPRETLKVFLKRKFCDNSCRVKTDQKFQLYEQYLTDEEIANQLGLQKQSVANWRSVNNLVANPRDKRYLPCRQSGCQKYGSQGVCLVLDAPGWRGGESAVSVGDDKNGKCWAWTDDPFWANVAELRTAEYERAKLARVRKRVARG